MSSGMNLRFNVERINYQPDDVVGGAVTTGTVVYEHVFGRLEGVPPDQMFLFQGLETDRHFRITLQPGNLDIRERDYIRVVFPVNHRYYNKDLRVLGTTYSNHSTDDPRSKIILDVSRSVRAHTIE